jgi:hypothetical protein
MAGKQTKSVVGIENFVRGAHKRDEYEMPNKFMTDVREILFISENLKYAARSHECPKLSFVCFQFIHHCRLAMA